MVTDAEGRITDAISIENKASKGKKGGRNVPMNQQLRKVLEALQAELETPPSPERPAIKSERGGRAVAGGAMSPASIADWFGDLYRELGFDGCSSHSGRRTFITRAARKISAAGAASATYSTSPGTRRSRRRRPTSMARAMHSAKSST